MLLSYVHILFKNCVIFLIDTDGLSKISYFLKNLDFHTIYRAVSTTQTLKFIKH